VSLIASNRIHPCQLKIHWEGRIDSLYLHTIFINPLSINSNSETEKVKGFGILGIAIQETEVQRALHPCSRKGRGRWGLTRASNTKRKSFVGLFC
jgi:hypothetical protein